jgi:hypothetical protein
MLTRKRDDRPIGALPFSQVAADGVEILDGALDPARDHHGPRLPTDLVQPDNLLVEMVDHYLGLELDGVVVTLHVEMIDASAKLEEQLAGIAIAFVLLDCVVDCLLGKTVLQLESGDRQAIDEEAEIERKLRLVAAILELAGDAEAVLSKALGGLLVAGRRRAVEEIEVILSVVDLFRRTSITPRFATSPCKRARNFRRLGLS